MVSTDLLSTPNDVSDIFVRTRKCRFYGMGKCTRGSKCTFAHTAEELRPRFDLAGTKLCPTLLKTGSCTGVGCTYAHRDEDLRRKSKQHRQGSKEMPTGHFNSCRPNSYSLLFDDTFPEPLVDKSTLEAGLGAAKVGGNRRDSMINMQRATNSSDHVALSGSVKDGVFPKDFLHSGFFHHAFHVSVKNTFIDVDDAYASSPVGLRRVSSAPGSISSTADNHGFYSI
eukprot:TRINITY_DN5767_c0_g1_i7.p1 TRINITY_DN5767_c0_g1~~TRINITY_DN5767_c0_g1_i7.p1  ORF type:complete len:237 (-),score=22.53 TRINITY_DN5767_c0_g1_i7:169-846(-)